MKPQQKAILKTLVYADLFDYPLTAREIFRLLIIEDKRLKPSLASLEKDLRELKKTKKVKSFKDNFTLRRACLAKGGARKLVNLKKRRLGLANQKRKKAKKISSVLIKIPFIKLIGLTGSVAFNNAQTKDDIDLLIVTGLKRLWLTRLLVVFILELWGQRRRPDEETAKDKICLNLFLTQGSLALPSKRRNLFTAHELGQLEVLNQKDNTYAHFLKANLWVRKFLPHLFAPHKKMVALKDKTFISNSSPLDYLETMAFKLQLAYMKKKRKSEDIGFGFAFFHPHDMSKKIIKKYQEKVKRI